MASKALQTVAKELDAALLADNKTHKNRMEIASESSNRVYIVAQAKKSGEWQCSCPGWIIKKPGKERSCKHLKAIKPALQAVSQPKKKLR